MANLYVQETFVNATEGHRFGESEPFESFTDRAGELYRSSLEEYGRCKGRVFVDNEDGRPIQIGWVFEGKSRYEDTNEEYLREVWVTVHEAPPERTVSFKYHDLGDRP